MDFKSWLKLDEVGTGTNAVAVFSRPIGIGTVERTPVEPIVFNKDDDFDGMTHHKKKKKKFDWE